MPSKRQNVVLSLDGREDTFTIDSESFDNLIVFAHGGLYDDKNRLESEPIDWDSPSVRKQFENILSDLESIRGLLDDAKNFRTWLREPLPEPTQKNEPVPPGQKENPCT